ncbi:DUF5906 domain-containing protein [Escherichia coli]|uniref:DUF5906 domain-containing protein n=1 Tax=Escherichia coli TaxID=562 RepID=UPI001DDC5385|nr:MULTISPECIES: DUF5906 domain-containing protein [Enterobacterales]EFN6654562.1 helicase [Escherichia coli O166:H6]EFN6737882.1 helicase [Escherichia coli H6]MDE8641942.1 DUF5906 domain-containing protein [Proteus mirabilis]
MKYPVTETKHQAHGIWSSILHSLKITVPEKNRHGPCPVCGGTDRFHFIDDHGNGEWHCRHCDKQYGDGLDLVSRFFNINLKDAAKKVATVIGNDARSSSTPAKKEKQNEKNTIDIVKKVTDTLSKAPCKPSSYLAGKGITGYEFHTLPDGKLFLPIINANGVYCGAQTIAPDGRKCLIKGTRKKGAFITPSPLPESPQTIIIAEGLATAISANMLHTGAVVAAIDAGNLKPVAMALRGRYPEAKIIIAGDNDWCAQGEIDEHGQPKKNIGKICGTSAAGACKGWLTLPPDGIKMDWNDYVIENGIEVAKAVFNANLKNMSEEYCTLANGSLLSVDEIKELEQLNKIYTHTQLGETTVIASIYYNQTDKTTHRFLKKDVFKDQFLHEKRIAKKNKGEAWLNWAGKSMKLGGVGFYPCNEKCPDDVYNLFTGWGIKPVIGDVTPYLKHLKEVICDHDQTTFDYLIGWLAHMIQRPDEKPSVAIALKAIQGTGKGTMVKPLLQITGAYGEHISGISSVTGRFNNIIVNKLLLFIDEVIINSEKDANKIKTIISEETLTLEKKGIDAQSVSNFSRLIFASNSEKMLRAGIRERRYLVLTPSPERAQEKGYFDHLHNWINNGGASHLMHYLLHYNISTFDPHRAPATKGLADEILSNLPLLESFIYSELCSETPFGGQARIFATEEVNKLINYSLERGENITVYAARRKIGHIFKKIKLEPMGRNDRGDGIYYSLPAKEDAKQWNEIRSAFAAHLNIGFELVFDFINES